MEGSTRSAIKEAMQQWFKDAKKRIENRKKAEANAKDLVSDVESSSADEGLPVHHKTGKKNRKKSVKSLIRQMESDKLR